MKLGVKEVQENGPLDLEEASSRISLPPDAPGFPSLVAPVRLSVHAEAIPGRQPADDEVLALIKAETRASLECARCLERFERPLQARVELHVPAGVAEVEVEEEVRQSLLLALPIKPLCRPDCKGLCVHCGKNKNLSPCGCADEHPSGPFTGLKDLKLR